MRAVLRKALADLWSRPWQSVLILATVAASAALLYLGLVSLKASTSPYDRLLARTNGPHVFFYLKGGTLGEETAAKITRLPGVVESSPVWSSATTELFVEGATTTPTVRLVGRRPGDTAVGRYVITAGRDLTASDTDAGLMEASLARFYKVKPDDTVKVAGRDGLRTITVVGLQANPFEYQFPWFDPVSMYVLPETFGSLFDGSGHTESLLGVRLADPDGTDSFVARAKELSPAGTGASPIAFAMDWIFMRNGFVSINATGMMFTLVFGIMAVLASALIIGNIIGGAVLAQWREIGVLKAIGFSGRQTLLVFGGQSLLLGLAGGLAGTAVGAVLAQRQLGPLAATMGAPEVTRFDWPLAFSVIAVTAAVALIFSLLPAWRAARSRPAGLLTDGSSQAASRPSLPVRLARWLRAPQPVVLGVKDATLRSGRQVLTVVSLVVGLASLTSAIGFSGLADDIARRPDLHGLNWDVMVGQRDMSPDEVRSSLSGTPAVEAFYPAVRIPSTFAGTDFGFELTAAGDGWTDFPFTLLEGRLPTGPGEIMLAPGAMRRSGVKVGDPVSVEIGGRPGRLTVTAVYRYTMSLGQTGFMSLESLRQIIPDAQPKSYVVRLRSGVAAAEGQRAILAATGYRVTASVLNKDVYFKSLTDVGHMARGLAALMAVIAALGVLNATLLTAREQTRETGIRKAAGMTPLQALIAGVAGAAWLGGLGTVIGFPLGRLMTSRIAGLMTTQFGTGHIDVSMSPLVSVALVAGWVVLAVAAAVPAAVWAGRLPTAEALRAE